MSYQHQKLAAGKWQKLPFCQQMANIGSEVERAIAWRRRKKNKLSESAFFRALELTDLAIAASRQSGRLKELTRMREFLVDDFYGKNGYASQDSQWQKYFRFFNLIACSERMSKNESKEK